MPTWIITKPLDGLGGFDGALQGLDVVVRGLHSSKPRLDSHDPVPVAGSGIDGQCDVGAAEVVELGVVAEYEAGRGDVQQGVEPGVGAVDDVAAEGGEGPRARGASVDGGRDAAAEVAGVGLDAVGGASPEGVDVQVDQPGCDDQAGCVDDLGGAAAVYRGLHGGHEPVLQGDVADGVQAL